MFESELIQSLNWCVFDLVEVQYELILFCCKLSTHVVTEINGHIDKRSSEIMMQKPFKDLNNNTTQTK